MDQKQWRAHFDRVVGHLVLVDDAVSRLDARIHAPANFDWRGLRRGLGKINVQTPTDFNWRSLYEGYHQVIKDWCDEADEFARQWAFQSTVTISL